jgi:glyoxylase-like metal-dependent hydrolase (beta-lactamase superfamily II)
MTAIDIIRIPILPFGMVNAHLIKSGAGCVLVDAGIPGSERKIERVLLRHGLSFTDIKLIIVTHAHTDHAGSAARLRALSRAPILAHRDDADF